MLVIDANAVNSALTWPSLVDAMEEAHKHGRPPIEDMLIRRDGRALLVRASWFDTLGAGVKAVTICPENRSNGAGLPSIQGHFLLFDGHDGSVEAIVDAAALTPWKTAADSALGVRLLARRDARVLLMVGAGAMARPLVEAHLAMRPGIDTVLVWNRTRSRAEALLPQLRRTGRPVAIADDLEAAVARADIISCATMAKEPILRGRWLSPGTHLDLVGAFAPDMREADDEVMRRGRLFVDARETTIHEIGEISLPIQTGVISEADIEADLFDLAARPALDRRMEDITVYKNGGGAHLDLVTARHAYRTFVGMRAASGGGPEHAPPDP